MFTQRTDILVREIQDFFTALNAVVNLRKEGKATEAEDHLKSVFSSLLLRSAINISELSVEEIPELCIRNGNFSSEMATAMAPLIIQQAEIYEEKDDYQQSLHAYRQARELYIRARADTESPYVFGIDERLQSLDQRIAELSA